MSLKTTFGTWARYLTRPIGESWGDFLDSILPLAAGSGNPLTGDLYIESAVSPSLFLQEDGNSDDYSRLYDDGNTIFYILKRNLTGNATVKINPIPADGTSEAQVTFYRDTNTVGVKRINIFAGDGSGTVAHSIANGDINLCQQGGKLDVFQDLIRLRTSKTPASAGDTGAQGDICWDADYIYVCIATDTWKRAAISTW